MVATQKSDQALTKKDFQTDQDVRWCPGCGDYSILAQVQKVLPDLGIPKEKIVFISGIGCSSRFPYYMNTYGFHTIHGRAPTIATGLRIARPDLKVFVITGDGDSLSIGGNHLIHLLRRNVDVTVLLFNNRIYGLTKGQYSPTSEQGKRTKSTPLGSPDRPFSPLSLAIGADAGFVARSVDTDVKHLQVILRRAADHKGTSLVEIYQNCNVFNDNAFIHITKKDVKDEREIFVEDGQPLLFGKGKDKGLVLGGDYLPKIVDANSVEEAELLVHDESRKNPAYASMLARLDYPDFPVAMGVLRAVTYPTYEEVIGSQREAAIKSNGNDVSISDLLRQGETWTVE